MKGEKELSTFGLSKIYLREVRDMPTKLKDLRLRAGWSAFQLAVAADVSVATINRMEKDKSSVRPLMANRILNALSEKLGQRIDLEDIENDD